MYHSLILPHSIRRISRGNSCSLMVNTQKFGLGQPPVNGSLQQLVFFGSWTPHELCGLMPNMIYRTFAHELVLGKHPAKRQEIFKRLQSDTLIMQKLTET